MTGFKPIVWSAILPRGMGLSNYDTRGIGGCYMHTSWKSSPFYSQSGLLQVTLKMSVANSEFAVIQRNQPNNSLEVSLHFHTCTLQPIFVIFMNSLDHAWLGLKIICLKYSMLLSHPIFCSGPLTTNILSGMDSSARCTVGLKRCTVFVRKNRYWTAK